MDGQTAERAARALAHAQGLLGGEDEVVTPVWNGGYRRRYRPVPWGWPRTPRPAASRPWPGALPPPTPRLRSDREVRLCDDRGDPITVDGRGGLSGEPARLLSGDRGIDIAAWTASDTMDHAWWRPEGRRHANIQVTLADERTLLLVRHNGSWRIEAVYD
jgi:protein ImuB